jgi:peptidylprolyl isomerase
MADPAKGVSKNEMMQYLVPALAIGALVILVGLVVLTSGLDNWRSMSDGSDGTDSDPGLRELTVGVKVRDLKDGTGEPCPPGANVVIHYTGWTSDGTVCETNKTEVTPATFPLASRLLGWREGIPGMKAGGVRKLVLAPEKAYGKQAKGNVPANSTVVFEIELISFEALGPKKMIDGSDNTATDPGLREVTPGVKARDLKEGSGEPVKPNATVTIHYVGWLADGTVFDSSRARGEPSTFPLEDLVKGWQEGIPGMKPGGVRKLVIAPEKGYGSRPREKIPANSTLIFEIELLK